MSDLYRSAIGARLAKLPILPSEEDDEAADSIGSLPSGLGPPAVQVHPVACYSTALMSDVKTCE